jgi:aryl-alcohol dehydrogenase-like predicted oxidoreductase
MSPTTGLATAPFGTTGHDSTRVLFGAAALGRMSQERADATLATVAEFGVNHIDTARDYGDSELRLAPWLQAHRAEVFLATKTHERSGDAARASLEDSLERLGVDHVDLIQLHNLVEEDEWQTAHGPGGAVEALAAARDEGLTRHIGVTGHGLRIAAMHRRSLEAFDFDSVLLPYNFVLLRDAGYRAEVEALLATCAERGVAVQTIKSLARRRWADGDSRPHHSWYDPLDDAGALARSVRWVLGHPGLFLNSSSDAGLLRATLEAASTPGPVPTEAELEADVADQHVEPLFDGNALERI